MKRIAFDQLSHRHSAIHHAPAGLKLAIALGLLGLVIAWRGAGAWLWCVAGLLFLIALLARLPLPTILLRLLFLEALILGVVLLALTGPAGWRGALDLLARCTLCLAIMIVLAATTPFWRLVGVLRTLRVPALLVTVLSLMYRYLFLLVEESQRLRRARASRTLRTPSRWGQWRTTGGTIGQLFIRASDRAERVYDAMRARGWS